MITTVPYGFLPCLAKKTDEPEEVAITSRPGALAEVVARVWNIPTVYDDLDTMLDHLDLDVVINETPIPARYETSVRLLAASK